MAASSQYQAHIAFSPHLNLLFNLLRFSIEIHIVTRGLGNDHTLSSRLGRGSTHESTAGRQNSRWRLQSPLQISLLCCDPKLQRQPCRRKQKFKFS